MQTRSSYTAHNALAMDAQTLADYVCMFTNAKQLRALVAAIQHADAETAQWGDTTDTKCAQVIALLQQGYYNATAETL